MSSKELVDWLDEFERNAIRTGDDERQKLASCVRKFAGGMKHSKDPRQLQLYQRGISLARQLKQPWLALFFMHGRFALAAARQDYRGMASLICQAMAVLHANEDFPLKYCIYHDQIRVIRARVIDRSRKRKIKHMLDYLEQVPEPDPHCQRCALRLRLEFALFDKRDLVSAERYARRLCSLRGEKDSDRKSRLAAHLTMCLIATRHGEWSRLAAQIVMAQQLLPLLQHPDNGLLAELQIWQAVSAKQQGNSDEAAELIYRAQQKAQADADIPQSRGYYEGLATCHLLQGDLPSAMLIRQTQLNLLRNRGMPAVEQAVESEIERLKAMLVAPLRN